MPLVVRILPRILHPILLSVLIPDQPTHRPPLADKKQTNESELAKILPQSPAPCSILAQLAQPWQWVQSAKARHPNICSRVSCKYTTRASLLLSSRLRTSRRNVPPHCPRYSTTLACRTYHRTVLGALGRREGYHRHSEFEYRFGLRDLLGDSVEGYPCAHSEREIVHGALCASFSLFSSSGLSKRLRSLDHY